MNSKLSVPADSGQKNQMEKIIELLEKSGQQKIQFGRFGLRFRISDTESGFVNSAYKLRGTWLFNIENGNDKWNTRELSESAKRVVLEELSKR